MLEDRLKIRSAAGCEHGNARSGHGAESRREQGAVASGLV
jgi:hypothetical protein